MSNIPPNAGSPNENSGPDRSAPQSEPQSQLLSAHDAAQLAARLAELSAAELPLAPGLRAAAAELGPGRLARAMQSLAAALERGQTLDQSLTAQQSLLPPSLRGLVAAGVRSGRLGEVLEQFVDFRQFVADMRRKVWAALVYPLLLLVNFAGLFVLLVREMAPLLIALQQGISTDSLNYYMRVWPVGPSKPRALPANLRLLQSVSQSMPIWLPAAAVALVLLLILFRFSNFAAVRRMLNRLPVVGPLWRFSGMAEFAKLLRLLVEHGIALTEALSLTADGIGDADVAAGCRQLAKRVQSGQSLSAALGGLSQFSPIERPLIVWGEKNGSLGAALETTAEVCVRRLRVWSDLLRGTLPLAMLLVIFAGVLFVASFFQGLIAGMINLISWNPGYAGVPTGGNGINIGVPAGALSLAIIGIALLISLRLIYAGRRAGDDLYILLKIVAQVLLVYAAFGLFVFLIGDSGVFVWFAALVIWGMIVFRLRRTQRQMFVDLMSIATRRGLPLGPAAHAFAEEEHGGIGRRAENFAARLDAGYSLPDAILATPRLLPPQDQLAIEIGQRTETMPVTLQDLVGETMAPERYGETIAVGSIGLIAAATVGSVCVLYASYKLIPKFQRIFADFHRGSGHANALVHTGPVLPPLSRHLFAILQSIEAPGLVLVILFGIVLAIFSLYFLAYLMGWTRAEFPLLNRFFAPRHTAVALRWFASAVRHKQSLWPLVHETAERYPNRLIRSRLRSAAQEIERGGDWISSFRRVKLIGRTDSALLRAASRAGNLAWALEETAAAARRRLAYRLQTISQIVMPLAILLVGGCVMLITVGFFLPLVTLISELAK